MPKFKVYCSWAMDAIVEIEASNLEAAITKVEISGGLPEGTYIDSSFEVGREITENINQDTIENASEGDA
jgi:hypothetical protein